MKLNIFNKSSSQAFTVPELVISMIIFGILAAIAIPAMLQWLPNMRLTSAARDIYGVFMQAKMEATKRNSNCTVVFNQTIAGVTYAYVLFQDNDPSAGRMADYDAGEAIITREERFPNQVNFNLTQGGGDGISFVNNDDGNPSVIFRPTTVPTDNNGGLANGSVFLINSGGTTKQITVNSAGNVRIQ